VRINKKLIVILLIILIVSSSNFVFRGQMTFSLGCQLYFLQNILLPFFTVPFLVNDLKSLIGSYSIGFSGALSGIIVGFIPTTTNIIVNALGYFFLGQRELAYSLKGQPTPPVGQYIVSDLLTEIFVWLVLMCISALIGLISSKVIKIKVES
jgi:hypothetical protein